MYKEELLAVIDSLLQNEEAFSSNIDYVRGLRDGQHIALEAVKEYVEENWA